MYRIAAPLILAGFFLLTLIAAPVVVSAQTETPRPVRTPAPPQPRAAATPAPKPAQPARTQPTRSVRRSTGSAPTSSKGTKKGKYVPPEFKIQADTNASILMIEPVDIRAKKGEAFSTEILLDNPRALPFSEFNVALKYEPAILQPINVNTYHMNYFIETADARVRPKDGVVIVKAKLTQTRRDVEAPLFNVRWKAVGDTSFSNLSFITRDGNDEDKTRILNQDGTNILGSEDTTSDGCLSSSVVIQPLFEDNEKSSFLRKKVASGINLSMDYEILSDTLEVGAPIRVDVRVENPEKANFNFASIEMNFNPDDLEVVDWDTDNWITIGTNVYDGAYKDNFEFTYQIANRVINTTGDITYKMGRISEKEIPKGPTTMFSILFKVRKPFMQTEVSFRRPETINQEGTRLTYIGRDVLGDPLQPGDGAEPVLIRAQNIY